MQGRYEIKRGVHIDDEDEKDPNVYEDSTHLPIQK